MFRVKDYIKNIFKIICNPHFAICLLIAWMITNGWGYLFIVIGHCFNNVALLTIGSSYVAFLWVPGTPEKILTVSIALALQKKFFPKHVSSDNPLKEIQFDENRVTQN